MEVQKKMYLPLWAEMNAPKIPVSSAREQLEQDNGQATYSHMSCEPDICKVKCIFRFYLVQFCVEYEIEERFHLRKCGKAAILTSNQLNVSLPNLVEI